MDNSKQTWPSDGQDNNEENMKDNDDDSVWVNVGWFVLSLLFPIVGIVLQIVFWKSHHSWAKACMWGWVIPAGLTGLMLLAMIGSLIFGGIASMNLI